MGKDLKNLNDATNVIVAVVDAWVVALLTVVLLVSAGMVVLGFMIIKVFA